MALETLKDVKEIGGFEVNHLEKRVTPDEYEKLRKFVNINHDENTITFKIQNGPIKEAGVNGCQVDTLIHAAKAILEGLNKNFPCEENALAINKLDLAIGWLNERTKNREKRGVEGTNNA